MLRTVNLTKRRSLAVARGMQTQAATQPGAPSMPPSMMGQPQRKERQEGDISNVFSSLSGEAEKPFPPRFGELKRKIIGDEANQRALIAGWERLTDRLRKAAGEIEAKQQDNIPQTTFEEFINSPTKELIDKIKTAGTFILRGAVEEETATQWLKDVQEYIAANPSVKGFPANDKQVFELYWSKTQLAARSHPRAMQVQRALLTLFSHGPDAPVSLHTPLSYADRLRIRHPGDAQFALGPHSDGGSVERWEDETYRKVYQKCLEGRWEEFDAWTIGERGLAKQNMYDGPGACGVFRAFQGWTSMSDTGPGEGTLKVYPLVKELTAYTMMRPLFREKEPRAALTHDQYLSSSNWELDFETPRFPNSPLARCQEFNDDTHPHLELGRTMISVPRVKPGDQAWWHCDVIHAVESVHNGTGPSAVLYIPAVPLTPQNAEYIRDQREMFLAGRPGPDFPGGAGESEFVGRGVEANIESLEGKQAMGLAPLDVEGDLVPGDRHIREKANKILGF
ncbi:hypothetical protein IAT38_001102 [Cryptococcus sp. DSM 104549]